MISKTKVPDSLWKNSSKLGQILYTSSGDYLAGKIVNTKIQIPLNGDPGVNTSPIDIVAGSCACKIDAATAPNSNTPDPENCLSYNGTAVVGGAKTSSLMKCHPAPDSLGMMGVGFDRGANPTTINNPFLNIPVVKHSGYVISQTGISVGLTQANTAGFKTASMAPASPQPTSGGTVWAPPQLCVSLQAPAPSGGVPPAPTKLCGPMLMDTGIDYMFLAFPQSSWPSGGVTTTTAPFDGAIRSIVTPGWQATVTVGDVLNYTLTAAAPPSAGGLPASESVMVWVNGAGFVNTGRRLLNNADYMFDQACGRLGFGPTQTRSGL